MGTQPPIIHDHPLTLNVVDETLVSSFTDNKFLIDEELKI